MTRLVGAVSLAGLAVAGALAAMLLLAPAAGAQTPTATSTATPTGTPAESPTALPIIGTARVTGTIASGTEGFAVPEGLAVQLIVLDGSSVSEPVRATVSGSRYEAEVPLTLGRVIIPRLVAEGVEYLGDPVTFPDGAAGQHEVTRDFRIYGVTREAPQLVIASSTVTVVAIDRERGQLGLLREDMVANPSDRVFIGDDQGVTLRIPAPNGAVEATGDNADGTFALERGVLSTTVPIRPGRLTSIVTRYVVEYERDADTYALRVTTPLPAEQLVARVPQGYAGAVRPEDGARRAPDVPLPQQGGGQVLQVVESEGDVPPGGGIVVNLVGLSRAVVQSNPLTEGRGALIAAAIALAIVGGGAAARWWWTGRAA